MKEPTVTVAARVPLPIWQALHERAQAEETSASTIVAKIINRYIKRAKVRDDA
jgi:hypothetical protein